MNILPVSRNLFFSKKHSNAKFFFTFFFFFFDSRTLFAFPKNNSTFFWKEFLKMLYPPLNLLNNLTLPLLHYTYTPTPSGRRTIFYSYYCYYLILFTIIFIIYYLSFVSGFMFFKKWIIYFNSGIKAGFLIFIPAVQKLLKWSNHF